MRTFRDGAGQEWEVLPGRESWGVTVALFVPRAPGIEVRQVPLMSASRSGAVDELEGFDDDRLRELLRVSEPKSP